MVDGAGPSSGPLAPGPLDSRHAGRHSPLLCRHRARPGGDHRRRAGGAGHRAPRDRAGRRGVRGEAERSSTPPTSSCGPPPASWCGWPSFRRGPSTSWSGRPCGCRGERSSRPGSPVRFRVTSKKSRLYHADAIAQRLQAIVSGSAEKGDGGAGTAGAGERGAGIEADDSDGGRRPSCSWSGCTGTSSPSAPTAPARCCTGAAIARPAGKAPLRETFAAAMLLAAGYDGQRATGRIRSAAPAPFRSRRRCWRGAIAPGLDRAFAFERWPEFDAAAWAALKAAAVGADPARRAGADRRQRSRCGRHRRRGGECGARRRGAGYRVPGRGGVRGEGRRPAPACWPPILPTASGSGAGETFAISTPGSARCCGSAGAGGRVAILVAGTMPEREMGLPFRTGWESSNGGIPIRLLIREADSERPSAQPWPAAFISAAIRSSSALVLATPSRSLSRSPSNSMPIQEW